MNMSKGNILPAFARRGECAQLKRSREATFEGRRRGGCVILRSLLIDARAAHRLKPFNKERFPGINKEASRHDHPPSAPSDALRTLDEAGTGYRVNLQAIRIACLMS